MKISFIIPFNSLTGGIKVVFTHANNLVKRGHKVVIYCPFFPYLFGYKFCSARGAVRLFKGLARSLIRRNNVNWFDLEAQLKIIPYVSDDFIEDSDVVIATAWPTAYSVYSLSEAKGKKIYFIQDYEIWSGPEEMVNNSYRLELNRIVSAPHLKELLEQKFGVGVVGVVPNGVDSVFYYESEKKFNQPRKILMLYHRDSRKGVKEGIDAIRIVRQKYSDIEVIMFSVRSPRRGELPSFVRFYKGLYGVKLAELYKSADIFISPSLSEGWHSPSMEEMAARCAVVATSVGSMKYIGIPNETAMICQPGDVNCLAESIIKLLEDEELLRKLSNNGYNIVRKFFWDKSTEIFEQILKKLTNDK
jgi:glycosyltransferase involved in cell wall biosynthesis